MKLSFPLALTIVTLVSAVPMPAAEPETVTAVIKDPALKDKRCCLWWLFFHPKPAPKPAPKPTPKPTTSCTPTTTSCSPTTTSCTPTTTTETTTETPTTSTPTTTTPTPEPTPPETKRDDVNAYDNLSRLFSFIDSADEADVNQFIHFYKNSDQADVEAWWNGKPVDNKLVPSFPASRIHEIDAGAGPST